MKGYQRRCPKTGALPQMHRLPCIPCHGAGLSTDQEWEEDGMRTITVRCESCCGHGEVADCSRCDEPISLPEYEQNSGYCGPCRADLEMADAAAEIARVRRWA